MTVNPFVCPNDPPCPHAGLFHDIYDFDDEVPTCCEPDCSCGKHPARRDRSVTREEYAALVGEPVSTDDQPRLTDEDLAEWQRRFEQANTPAARARHMNGEVRRLLSRRTRLRLWWRKQMTAAGLWSSR